MNKYYIYGVVLIATFAAGAWYGNNNKEVVIKENIKYVVQENVHTETEIIEKPDGTTVTKIVSDTKKETRGSQSKVNITKPIDKKWLVDLKASSSAVTGRFSEATYTLGISRKVLPGLYMGLYGNTEGQIGLGLSITF